MRLAVRGWRWALLVLVFLHPASLISQTNLPGVPYDRRFEPWRNTAGTTVYSVIRAAESLPGIVGKYGIVTNTVRRFERQGVALEKGASTTAWQTVRGQSEERTTGAELDKNPGWSKGETVGGDGTWQAWWWQRGSEVAGQSSTSRVVVTSTGGSGEIVRVMVGTLGDYAPVANFSVDASRMGWGDPGVGGTTKEYRVETEVYYRLAQGNFIVVNDGDSDNDGIRDYDDGYDKDGIVSNADDESSGVVFEELQLMLPPIDVRASIWVRIEYDATVLRAWLKDGYRPRNGASVAEGGDWVKPGVYMASQLGFSMTNFLGRLYLEGLMTGTNLTVNVSCSEDGITWIPIDKWKGPVLNVALVPDFNHDRKIDDADKVRVATNEIFHFWINDDHEISDADGEDWPGSSNPDYDDDHANGVRDLVDFFPVYLDIGQAVKSCPTNEFRYVIKQANGALNGVPTTLKADSANEDCKPEAYQTRLGVAQAMTNAQLKRITATGVEITGDGMATARTSGEGFVMLFEGRSTTTNPLVLEIRRRADDQLIAQAEMPLRLSSVENMYRWINLRHEAGGAEIRHTDLAEPSNNPDAISNGKNFVFVHGYSVDEQAAGGWSAETFKRLYWSGSRAKYYAVTWFGNDSQKSWLGGNTPDYQVNVVHALDSAGALASNLNNQVGGNITLAAHSLGNVLSSAAITKHGANVSKYFMIDGAVAIEAFDGSPSLQDDNMWYTDWPSYAERLWCSEWHTNFPSGDGRHALTWRDTFSSGASVAYNFYSSGEEVLKTHPHDTYPGLWCYFGGEYGWALQEKRKGLNWISSIGGSTYGGWGFNDYYWNEAQQTYIAPTNQQAILSHPFFRPGGSELAGLYVPTDTNQTDVGSQYATNHLHFLLAGFIPSRTLPVGANNVQRIADVGGGNFNMQGQFESGWPSSRSTTAWRHSDLREVAYLYVYKLFDKFRDLGGLNQP